MKHANWMVVATLVIFSGLAGAQQIGSTRIVSEVPFKFMVANKIVPRRRVDGAGAHYGWQNARASQYGREGRCVLHFISDRGQASRF